MIHGEHEKAAETECDTEPVALIHAAWLEKSLTIGAAEAATELRRLHEVEKQRDELLEAIKRAKYWMAGSEAKRILDEAIASVKGQP